jgi:hypothetical protein
MIEPSSHQAWRPASHDRLVRLRPRELTQIVFQHLHTLQDDLILQDCALGTLRAGLTEWQGVHHGLLVSLGWDWAEMHDGLRRLPVVPPRSNLRLLDPAGYDLPLRDEAELLSGHIDTLAWQQAVRLGLADPGLGPPAGPMIARLH